jgi:hypothetical protein
MIGDIRRSVQDILSESNFATTGYIVSFDEVVQTASVQISIKRLGGNTIQVIEDVIIAVPEANGYSVTLPIVAGDECLIVFCDRCIDNWHEYGGIQEQLEFRQHDLSDAFAIVGLNSKPNKIANYNTTDLEVRNSDRTTLVSVRADGKVHMKSPVQVLIDAPTLQVNGAINATGIIHSDIDVTTNENSVDGHTHVYNPGGGDPTNTSDANT